MTSEYQKKVCFHAYCARDSYNKKPKGNLVIEQARSFDSFDEIFGHLKYQSFLATVSGMISALISYIKTDKKLEFVWKSKLKRDTVEMSL